MRERFEEQCIPKIIFNYNILCTFFIIETHIYRKNNIFFAVIKFFPFIQFLIILKLNVLKLKTEKLLD